MTYQYKVGDKGKAKSGTSYEVICLEPRATYPIVCLLAHRPGCNIIGAMLPEHLIPPTRKETIWVYGKDGSIRTVASWLSEPVIVRSDLESSGYTLIHETEFEMPQGWAASG